MVGAYGPRSGGSLSCSPWDRCCSSSAPSPGTPAGSGPAGTRRPSSPARCSSRRLGIWRTERRWMPSGRRPRPRSGDASSSSSPGRIDWWATALQFAGTLYFNVSTGNALRVDLTATAANQHVWRPDAVGSACFLAASPAGLGRGLPWLDRLASPVLVLVDHAGQPDRIHCLRRVGHRRLHQPGDRPGAQRRAVESGYSRSARCAFSPVRCLLLPTIRGPASHPPWVMISSSH